MKWTDRDGFLEKIKDKSRYGIFLDMSLGKTALLLSLIDYKIFSGIKKVLILAPKNVTISTWQDEIKKWSNFNYLLPYVKLIEGTPKQRNEQLQDDNNFFIHIISADLSDWLVGKREKVGKRIKVVKNDYTPNYDLIIVDECSLYKSTTSKRFKALTQLDKGELFLLSGTPFSNIREEKHKNGFISYRNGDELYYVFKLFGLENITLTAFRQNFCYTNPWEKYTYHMTKQTYDNLMLRLDDHCIKKDLVLNIDKRQYKIYCDVSETEMKDLKNEFLIEIESGRNITAASKGIMINKALQLANGFAYNSLKETIRFNTFKFDVLVQLLSVIKSNVIIFYNFKEDKKFLMEHLEGARSHECEQDKIDWNDKKIKYFILSPFADKHGLNIQFGGSVIIWFGLVWSAESFEQSNARLFRTGQEEDVEIYYLLAENSYDDYVYDVIVAKTKTIKDFRKEIKR